MSHSSERYPDNYDAIFGHVNQPEGGVHIRYIPTLNVDVTSVGEIELKSLTRSPQSPIFRKVLVVGNPESAWTGLTSSAPDNSLFLAIRPRSASLPTQIK